MFHTRREKELSIDEQAVRPPMRQNHIHTSIPEWREKSFVQRYRVMRAANLIMECDEVRIFAGRRADNPEAIRALPIPPEIRSLCD